MSYHLLRPESVRKWRKATPRGVPLKEQPQIGILVQSPQSRNLKLKSIIKLERQLQGNCTAAFDHWPKVGNGPNLQLP